MLTGHKNWVRQLSGAGDAWEELPTDGTQTMATVRQRGQAWTSSVASFDTDAMTTVPTPPRQVPKGETAETVVFRVTAQNSAGWSPVRRPRAQR